VSLTDTTRGQLREIIARYPQPRSALLPMLHLIQAEEGYVTPAGIEMCADELGLTPAEVSAVATFYTMYKRRPNGEYLVGVCTNTLCAIMGGDLIFEALQEHLGVANDETTEDGRISLEHIECNAACDYAPVVMVNWEFFDNQTIESAVDLVDGLRGGTVPQPTRGAPLCTFKETERILAGFPDRRPGAVAAGGSAGPASTVGLRIARERGDSAPERDDRGGGGSAATEHAAQDTRASGQSGSSHSAGVPTAESDDAAGSSQHTAREKGEST
jgi:NADH-quinone oxidoreductase subunit E